MEATWMLEQPWRVLISQKPFNRSNTSAAQSYNPSCSQMSTRKCTISTSGIGWGNGLLLPSKLSYDAFQLNLGSRVCWTLFSDLLLPTQRCLVWFQRRRPWFTNSEGVLGFPATPCKSRIWLVVLIDDKLPCDWTALLSISHVLVVQKSSDMLGFFTFWPWICTPFDCVSNEVVIVGLV